MTIDIALLWRLQTTETAARVLVEDLARMPKALERAREDQRVREGELKAREAEREDRIRKRRAVEKEIEDLERKIHENLTRQGGARTNAELDAFKKEAAYLREHKSGLETRVLEMFDEEEAHQERIVEARTRVERAREVAAKRQAEIEQKADGERRDLERLQKECADLAAELPAPVRSRFDQILKAKNGVAVAPVQRGACGGCFNALPPQFVNEVRKAERLVVCESCGRIIVWLDENGGISG